MDASHYLNEGIKILEERGKAYGGKEETFAKFAEFWTTWLKYRFGFDKTLTPADAAIMMSLMKSARLAGNIEHPDSYIDGLNYLACGAEMALTKKDATNGASPEPSPATGDFVRVTARLWGKDAPTLEVTKPELKRHAEPVGSRYVIDGRPATQEEFDAHLKKVCGIKAIHTDRRDAAQTFVPKFFANDIAIRDRSTGLDLTWSRLVDLLLRTGRYHHVYRIAHLAGRLHTTPEAVERTRIKLENLRADVMRDIPGRFDLPNAEPSAKVEVAPDGSVSLGDVIRKAESDLDRLSRFSRDRDEAVRHAQKRYVDVCTGERLTLTEWQERTNGHYSARYKPLPKAA